MTLLVEHELRVRALEMARQDGKVLNIPNLIERAEHYFQFFNYGVKPKKEEKPAHKTPISNDKFYP